MEKKLIGIFICIILSFNGVVSVSGTTLVKNTSNPLLNGDILYVGGSGPGNYTNIQDAIDDANNGDTVYVYDDSSPYQLESYLNIEKSINLIGENRETTVIDGSIDFTDGLPKTNVLIFITETDWVNISGFTITNSENCGLTVYMADNINISGNIFIDTGTSSIAIIGSNYSCISDNICTSTKVDNIIKDGGIILEVASFTTIIGNTFTNCFVGITIIGIDTMPPYFYSNSNIISGNLFDNNNVAMEIRANDTLITKNTISNHTDPNNLIWPALSLAGCNNTITCNNFINNIRDANNVGYIFSPQELFNLRKNRNVWDGNYWDRPRSLPKFILSYIRYERGAPEPTIFIPWITFDMHPAKEPYDIVNV